MSAVGIIANPSAGKDIRRLVAQARVVTAQEKVNILRRVLIALDALGIERVLIMPDRSMLGLAALEDTGVSLQAEVLAMPVMGREEDSTLAAQLMAERGVACIVTLGGDGTNRAVALGCGSVPLMPISTGTNNVFPQMIEGTTAGLAAALYAKGLVDKQVVSRSCKRLEVYVDGAFRDIALIDVAISREPFVASRAIWDVASISELFLTRADAMAIGLSAIGASLQLLSAEDRGALHLQLGASEHCVLAAIAPGSVQNVSVQRWALLEDGQRVPIATKRGTIALDGERQIEMLPDEAIEIGVSAEGPSVINASKALTEAARRKLFVNFGYHR